MLRWAEEFKDLAIFQSLSELENNIEDFLNESEPEILVELSRFYKVVLLIKRTLSRIDPDVAPIETINQLHAALNSSGTLDAIDNYKKSKSIAYIRQANSLVNGCLSYVYILSSADLDSSSKVVEINSANEAFSIFVKNTNLFLDETEDEVKSALNQVEELRTQIDKVKSENVGFVETINRRFEEISSGASNIISKINLEFSESQTERLLMHDKLLQRVSENADTNIRRVMDEAYTNIGKKQEDITNLMDSIRNDIKKKHEYILEIARLTASDSVAGGHQSIANREYKLAQLWRRITMTSIMGTALWLLFNIFQFKPHLQMDHIYWTEIGKTVSLTLVLFSLSFYSSRQSIVHRANETKARSFSLKISAIDPLISDLPEDRRHALKEQMSKQIFDETYVTESEFLDKTEYQGIERFLSVVDKLRAVFSK